MSDVTGMPQSAVVIGGGSDLARAVLERLAARRLRRCVLAGRSARGLEETARALRSVGVDDIETVVLDVSDRSAYDGFVDACVERLGTIDLVLVAAGTLPSEGLEAIAPVGVAEAIEANFSGPAALIFGFARRLVAQGSGRIVVFSSVAGVRVRRANFVYGSAKAGLDGFSQGLGDALAGTGVAVTIVRPGFVPTKMTRGRPPQPLATTPAAVGDAVVRALETGADVVYVPAALRALFAAARLAPRALWRRAPS